MSAISARISENQLKRPIADAAIRRIFPMLRPKLTCHRKARRANLWQVSPRPNFAIGPSPSLNDAFPRTRCISCPPAPCSATTHRQEPSPL